MAIDTVLVQDSGHFPAALGDQVVVLSVSAGACFELNRTGGKIWDMLAEPRRVGDIFNELSKLYDVDNETVIRDVTPFLQELVARRLVRSVDPGPPR